MGNGSPLALSGDPSLQNPTEFEHLPPFFGSDLCHQAPFAFEGRNFVDVNGIRRPY